MLDNNVRYLPPRRGECSLCGAAPARLYPAGWRCEGCAPVFEGAYTPMPPPPDIRRLTSPGPCRLCHRPSWGADRDGPVHPCCLAWHRVIAAGYPCPACVIAENILRQPTHNPDGTIRQNVLPKPLPLPRFLPDGTPYTPG